MTGVGVVVNPWAGKDVRRLHAAVGHTPDTAKIGVVRRVIVAVLEAGVDKVHLAADVGRIAERAAAGIDGAILVDGPSTGSALDTRRASAQLAELGCTVIVGLGGDGTCRDITIGWPDVTLVPISTGTNNVFPRAIDGSSAGTAAGVLAAGLVARDEVCRRAKRLVVHRADHDDDIALVDVAIVATDRTGARAVVDAGSLRGVVAAISTPMSTGLSSVAGRTAPLDSDDDRAAVVRTGDGGRVIRVPLVPGRFDDVGVAEISYLDAGDVFVVDGPCVLAYDGERDRVLRAGDRVTISVDRLGPFVVDVERTLALAGERRLFDRTELPHSLIPEAHDGN